MNKPIKLEAWAFPFIGIIIITIIYFTIPMLHSAMFGGKEIIPDHECEEGYFLAYSNADSQWLCGKCNLITTKNVEYLCDLEYKNATKIP